MPVYEYGPNYEHEYEYGNDDDDGHRVNMNALIAEKSFLGDHTFQEIIEGITHQFRNYITTDDSLNYVDIFYNQLSHSLAVIASNDEDDVKDYLHQLETNFTDEVMDLLMTYIGITVDDNTTTVPLREIIETSYEYFILNARDNFKTVIASKINDMLMTSKPLGGNASYVDEVRWLVTDLFSRYLFQVMPSEFIRRSGAHDEIASMYDNHIIVGNFIMKYTPRLYKHEEFSLEIIGATVANHELRNAVRSDRTYQSQDSVATPIDTSSTEIE